ncbi:hypothetical protein BDQ17DRAFT_1342484 [Cyathus striatus]|nr:hypothetical protein BDQ17DRAFT_1342484 [Cyathus striatus]
MSGVSELNSYLEETQQSHLVTWAQYSSGPPHAPVWTIQCKFLGQVLGTGVGPNKASARDSAARDALRFLQSR